MESQFLQLSFVKNFLLFGLTNYYHLWRGQNRWKTRWFSDLMIDSKMYRYRSQQCLFALPNPRVAP